MMTPQARPSAKIIGFDTHMILEAVPARHSNTRTGIRSSIGTSRHYAEALFYGQAGLASQPSIRWGRYWSFFSLRLRMRTRPLTSAAAEVGHGPGEVRPGRLPGIQPTRWTQRRR